MSTTEADCFRYLHPYLEKMQSKISFFERRPQQEAMMEAVAGAYRGKEIAIIEAETGTGKSLAYLLPALLWAVETKERTVISTHTITLQQQLLYKDLPLLQNALSLPVKACIVKGMRNYLCLRRLAETSLEKLFLSEEEKKEVEQVERWAEKTQEGSRSTLPMASSGKVWDRVCAEHDTCTHRRCPYYSDCFFFRARKEAQDAQLLIVNHHLLFSDLAQRMNVEDYEKAFVLPPYQHVILDEAHHVEDVATVFFAERCNRKELLQILGRVAAEGGKGEQGKLVQLRQKLLTADGETAEVRTLLTRVTEELAAFRKTLGQAIVDAFQTMEAFLYQEVTQKEDREVSLRLLERHSKQEFWQRVLVPDVRRLIEELRNYSHALAQVVEGVREHFASSSSESIEGICYEIGMLAKRLEKNASTLSVFLSEEGKKNQVQWMQSRQGGISSNVEWVQADLSIASVVQRALLTPFSSVIFCSATLTSQQSFAFFQRRLGMDEAFSLQRVVRTHLYESPFNYAKQMFFGIPSDFSPPDDPRFLPQALAFLQKVVEACRGNALFLFTSYAMMDHCHRFLRPLLEKLGYPVLKQGEDNRHFLLERFRTQPGAVLFGTRTFWEGIDVQGEALGCVVIVKLPFSVPSEPLAEARMEALTKEGRSAFWEMAVPQAVMRFKQAVGRLIRNAEDRGCVLCLDVRLGKEYGKVFLQSLPPCPLVIAEQSYLLQYIRQFFVPTN